MRINNQTNAAPRTAYKVQNAPAFELKLPAEQLPKGQLSVARDTFASQELRVPKELVNPQIGAKAEAQASAQPNGWQNLLEVVSAATNPLGLLGYVAGKALGALLFGAKQEASAPAPAAKAPQAPASQAPAPTPGDRRRLEGAFRELDEDGNGRLEGDELADNGGLLAFDRTSDAGMTMGEFVNEVAPLEGSSAISADAIRAQSVKGKIFALMTDVWGTDAYCNETSYKWWKGQLKLVGGDYEKLREKMADYKKSIER
jgi:hypothetical protein